MFICETIREKLANIFSSNFSTRIACKNDADLYHLPFSYIFVYKYFLKTRSAGYIHYFIFFAQFFKHTAARIFVSIKIELHVMLGLLKISVKCVNG